MNIRHSLYAIAIIAVVIVIAIALDETSTHPLTLEQEIDAALVRYNPNITKYPHTITIDKQSGEYIRFHNDPKPGTELDPAFGFAKNQSGIWTILNIGTGGDPTEFYTRYNIPNDLRDKVM